MSDITAIARDQWERLFPQGAPFLDQRYLQALEASDSVGPVQGWEPAHIALGATAEAALPLYLKTHSYGEYVFDWSWARAATSYGIDYYPKLVTAVPYTPASGPRLGYGSATDVRRLLQAVQTEAEHQGASSWHLLFADTRTSEQAKAAAPGDMHLLERHGCQFRWHNRDYQDFDDYLSRFASRKRKGIRRERRKVHEQGVRLRRVEGAEIDDALLKRFYRFYRQTYHVRGQTPYLTAGFFRHLRDWMPEHLMLVCAETERQPVACALFLKSARGLYGRWWGGDPTIDCLHFETCYYQGIEYAIEKRLAYFDPGTQGEHKLLRGFEPVITRSLHWLRDPGLSAAVAAWLRRERQHIAAYREEARTYLPFKCDL
nr:GNAT family N-acetyltransferase [Motiliproteus sp. SC1-56]